ncbi:MAG: hypothetical protein ACPHLK_06910 [Gammaproteobacteria bacterium]|jgi:outer membrane biogenesis lipoprotein LolB
MGTFIKITLLIFSCSCLIACSNESDNSAEAKKDHVWKEQTDAIDKAKEAEGMLMDSATNMQNAIESQE